MRAFLLILLILITPSLIVAQPSRSASPGNYTRNEWLHHFAGTMLAKGLLDSTRHRDLVAAIDSGSVNSSIDLLGYLNHTLVVDLRSLPKDPVEYYRIIFERIKSIIPGFDFSDLQVTLPVPHPEDPLAESNALITMRIGDRVYSQSTFYSPDFSEEKFGYLGMVGNDFYEIVNKWLADERADYRLHKGEYLYRHHWGTAAVGYDRVGLILLTAEQQTFFAPYWMQIMPVHEEPFNEYLGPRGIERAIAAYKELGLFKHLTDEQIREGTTKALAASIKNVNDILREFKDVMVEIALESTLWDGMYADNLREIAATTHGAFAPTDIHDGYRVGGSPTFDFSFKVGSKVYSARLTMEDDWLDPRLFSLIDSAIAENIPDGKFYSIESGDGGDMIFLTRAQHDTLKARGLFLFSTIFGDE